jgi:hypothetical protein
VWRPDVPHVGSATDWGLGRGESAEHRVVWGDRMFCGRRAGPKLRGHPCYPMRAVISGVVVPLPRIEYRYGVFGNRPMSVNEVSVTVAIRIPDRSTS